MNSTIISPILDCKYCHHNHNIKFCPKLAKKREDQARLTKYRETDLTENFPELSSKTTTLIPAAVAAVATKQPSWSKLVKITGDPKVLEKVSKFNASVKQQKENAYQRKQEECTKECTTRQDKQKERERIWQLEQPRKMREKYGPNWYQYVAQTDEDCDKADDLRRDADHSSFLREKEEEKQEDEATALYNHNKATMTPQEFQEWEDEDETEKDEAYETAKVNKEIYFMSNATKENKSLYIHTGIMKLA